MNTDKYGLNLVFASVFICVYLWLFACSAAAWSVTPVLSLQKLTATAPGVLEKYDGAAIQLEAARGEWENFQIVVQAGDADIAAINPILSDWASATSNFASENLHLYWENYVFVAKPSGNRRLERLWWPDALIPADLQDDTSLKAYRARVLWVNVRVPLNTAPGLYKGQIQIRADNESKSLPVTLRVQDVRLPSPTMRANVAVYYDVLRDWYAKNARALSDSQFAELKKNYYNFLLDYRLNAYDLPVAWDSEAAQAYLRDPRVLSVRTPPLANGDFNIALSALKNANALKKAYYYAIDEPAPEQYPAVKAATKKLRPLDVRHCVTAHPNRALAGAVDIWCPNIGDFFGLGHLDFAALAAEREKGRETWWYTMVEPKYPYPTWLLDDDASAVRIYGWLMARHGINGFVYSMAHGWGPKPLENLQSFADTNGDGTLIYPAAALDPANLHPLPSIRLMLLRDAIEDYELLRLLNEADRCNASADLVEFNPFWFCRGFGTWNESGFQHARKVLFVYLSRSNSTFASVFVANQFIETERVPPITQVPLPSIDGRLDDIAWSNRTKRPSALSRFGDEIPPVTTNLWLAHSGDNLLVAARCPLMPHAPDQAIKGEWFAVDLAPPKADVRWRFVVTPSGKGVVEKHSREGHFRIEGANWKFAARPTRDFYTIEMQIPLHEIGLGRECRFNALRRLDDTQLGIKYLLRAEPDSGDVTLMPLLRLQAQAK